MKTPALVLLLTAALVTTPASALSLSATQVGDIYCAARLSGDMAPVLAMADMGLAHRDDVPTVPSWYWSDPPKSVAALKSDPTFLRVYGEKTYSSGEPGHASKPIDFTALLKKIDTYCCQV